MKKFPTFSPENSEPPVEAKIEQEQNPQEQFSELTTSHKKRLVVITGLAIIAIFSFLSYWQNLQPEDAAPLAPREAIFEYYGWFMVDYVKPTPALKRIRAYTNTAFAYNPLQTKVLKETGFPHIVYVFNPEETLSQLDGGNIPEIMIGEYKSGVKDYIRGIPGYREKFFTLYRAKLTELKRSLEEAGTLGTTDIFYLADEPALHRNIYLDQAFLGQLVAEFKQVFPDKKASMAFAQNPDPLTNSFPGTGKHLAPPPLLDIVMIDPYIDPLKVGCERENIRAWLYEENPYSNISWAKQYGKPIIVAGDAQLRKGKPLDACYPEATFEILKDDPDIHGLIWFAYDRSYKEEELSGAANDPQFVRLIENLAKP